MKGKLDIGDMHLDGCGTGTDWTTVVMQPKQNRATKPNHEQKRAPRGLRADSEARKETGVGVPVHGARGVRHASHMQLLSASPQTQGDAHGEHDKA